MVYDSGIGVNAVQMKELMNKNDTKSFGFKGIIERVRYYSGEEDVYEIRSEEGVFTEIDLKLLLSGGK